MDKLNKRIVSKLSLNARESFAKVGVDVGLSAPAVAKRVRQMERDGIIEGYGLKLNQKKLGIDIKAYISLKTGHSDIEKAKQEVLTMKGVISCDRVTGDDCIMILAYFENNKSLITFLEVLSKFGSTRTSIILEE